MSNNIRPGDAQSVLAAIQKINSAQTRLKFPSDYIDPETKKTQGYFLQCARAAHTNFGKGYSRVKGPGDLSELFQEWRDYARGAQSVGRYKKMLKGEMKKKSGLDFSLRNLDQQPLGVAQKFVNLLMGMLLNRPAWLEIRAIDALAQREEKAWELKLQDEIINGEWMRFIEQSTGMPMERALEQGVPPPDSVGEIPFYKEMFYKNRYASELTDLTQIVQNSNRWPILEEQMARDIIEVGVTGTRTYHDGNGFVKQRVVKYENTIHNPVKEHDFSDLWLIGEYVHMTISQIRELSEGRLSEETLINIANKYSGNSSYDTSATAIRSYATSEYGYPYDDTQVPVLDLTWLSDDKIAHTITKGANGIEYVEKVGPNFLSDKKISDDEYAQQSGGRKRVMRGTVQNRYGTYWVVDTEVVFGYGRCRDMMRKAKSIQKTELGYILYTTNWDSIIRNIIPILDNIHINWMQYQHHAARSTPSGASIEMTALQDIALTNGGTRLHPREVLDLAFDSGIKLWKRIRNDGASNQFKPWEEMQNGMSPAAKEHWQFILSDIDMLRQILGINEVTDASTPNPKIGKFVTQTAVAATSNVMALIFRGYDWVRSRSAEQIGQMIPYIIKHYGWNYGLTEALGSTTMAFLENMADLSTHDYSIQYKVVSDNEKRDRIRQYTAISLEKQAIGEEDAILIDDEPNPYKAAQMLKVFRRMRMQERMAEQQQMAAIEQEKNAGLAQASHDFKLEELEKTHELKSNYMREQEALQQQRDITKFQYEILMLMMQQGHEMGENERKRLDDLMKVQLQLISAEKNKQSATSQKSAAAKS